MKKALDLTPPKMLINGAMVGSHCFIFDADGRWIAGRVRNEPIERSRAVVQQYYAWAKQRGFKSSYRRVRLIVRVKAIK